MKDKAKKHTDQKRTIFTEEASAVLTKIQPIFAEVSGVSPEEMDMYSDLEEDLSVNMLKDMPIIIRLINDTYAIELDLATVRDEVTSVGELVTLIIEEKALVS